MKKIIHILLFALIVFSCKKPGLTPDKDNNIIEIPDTESGLFFQPEELNADSPCTIWFKPDKNSKISSPLYNCTSDLYAHIGLLVEDEWAFVQADWNENKEKCRFEKIDENLYKLEITPSIREYFNSKDTPLTTLAIVVRNSKGTKQTKPDQFAPITDDKYKIEVFQPDEIKFASTPSGALEGINYNDDNSVTLVLYGKNKSGERHDYAYVIGDFSNWKRVKQYMMNWDEEKGYWWYTFSDVNPSKEYLFQYHLGDDTQNLRLNDAYSEVVYDPWNDQYISSSTYPNITQYPKETKGLVSAFKINKDPFSWVDFKINDENSIVIYEMLFRDFSSSHDINGALEKLDYLEDLGVGAVELMPIQEFDGNESWGYNPNSYFALDKAYGTPFMYKTFINECHKRGIAVIVDVVYNHATGSHPFAKMYWDSETNNVSPENPWFNVITPHGFGVFHDWNHQEPMVSAHVKRSLEYLMTEYHVDGFRFDLTKGFTNNTGKDSSYDQQRVDKLKEYGNFIKSINPHAMVIFEHFVDVENFELGKSGFHMWGNNNNAYRNIVKGTSADLSYAYDEYCYRVSYMESHDEERLCYAIVTSNPESEDPLELKMRRAGLAAAHFLTIPGPRMIWQFGELGYDYSINYNGSNVSPKPVKWDYLDIPARKALHDTYTDLIRFRKENPEFFTKGADFHNGKTHYGIFGEKAFLFIGNFDNSTKTISTTFPTSGKWHNWSDTTELYTDNTAEILLKPGEFRLLVNF